MAGRNIILVDDEQYVTSVVAAKLQKQGDDVRTAIEGEEAFQLAIGRVPDLVVTDQQMPVTNGYQLAIKLRNDPRTANVPVIMLTARGYLLSPAELALTNIRTVVAKPFSTRDLLQQIDKLACKPGNAQEIAR
jgi:CheY-like chemotaxis protein